MSLKSNFHTTENLLIERARLHGLVDFFWQHLPYTRDDVLGHLLPVGAGNDRHLVGDVSVRDGQDVTVGVVELDRDVAGDLEVLFLILADGDVSLL